MREREGHGKKIGRMKDLYRNSRYERGWKSIERKELREDGFLYCSSRGLDKVEEKVR